MLGSITKKQSFFWETFRFTLKTYPKFHIGHCSTRNGLKICAENLLFNTLLSANLIYKFWLKNHFPLFFFCCSTKTIIILSFSTISSFNFFWFDTNCSFFFFRMSFYFLSFWISCYVSRISFFCSCPVKNFIFSNSSFSLLWIAIFYSASSRSLSISSSFLFICSFKVWTWKWF